MNEERVFGLIACPIPTPERELARFVYQHAHVLGEAGGEVLLWRPLGDPRKIDKVYHGQRTPAMRSVDVASAKIFDRQSKRFGSEAHYIAGEYLEIIDQFDIKQENLPTILFVTGPPINAQAVLRLDVRLFNNALRRKALADILLKELSAEKLLRFAVDGGFTMSSMVKLQHHLNSVRSKLLPEPPNGAEQPWSCEGVIIMDEGGVYEIVHGNESTTVRRSKGMAILKILVDNPGREYRAIQLSILASGVQAEDKNLPDQETPEFDVDEDGNVATRLVDGEPIKLVDSRTIRNCQRRLGELELEIEKAKQANDLARLETLTKEREMILQYLPHSHGGKGTVQLHSEQEEKARKNVAKLIRNAISTIRKDAPATARYLDSHINTGYRCCYMGSGNRR